MLRWRDMRATGCRRRAELHIFPYPTGRDIQVDLDIPTGGVWKNVEFCTSAASSGSHVAPSQHLLSLTFPYEKMHLKNVGPIRHNEPPHAHSADVASGTVARRLRIDVYDNDNA